MKSKNTMAETMTIGEAAKASGISTKMLRHYEAIGLIEPVARSSAGYRLYRPSDMQRLQFVRRARLLGFSLARIGELLKLWQDGGRQSADVKQLALQHVHELDADIAKLQSIREQLQTLADHCHGDQRPDCPILEELSK